MSVTEKLLAKHPDDIDRIDSAARTLSLLGQAHFNHGKPEQAVSEMKRGVELLERLFAKRPKAFAVADDLTRSRAMYGRALVVTKQYADAVAVLRVAMPEFRARTAKKPTEEAYLHVVLAGIAFGDALRATRDDAGAQATYRDARADLAAGLHIAPDSTELRAIRVP